MIAQTLRLAIVALAMAGCAPPPVPLEENHAPLARVIVPQLWPVGVAATIDGSPSSDEDGDPLRFVIQWGDGGPAVADGDGVVEHAYAAPGTFALELLVTDAAALESRVPASIVIIGDGDSGCSCDTGCPEGAVCTERGCLRFFSAHEEPTPAFQDALDCR